MNDLTRWANINYFSGHEATCLIIGLTPEVTTLDSSFINHIIHPMKSAYGDALARLRYEASELANPGLVDDLEFCDPPEFAPLGAQIYSIDMCRVVKERQSNRNSAIESWLESDQCSFVNQQFSREELSRWIFDNKFKTVYQFSKELVYIRNESRVSIRKKTSSIFGYIIETDFFLEIQRLDFLHDCAFGESWVNFNDLNSWSNAIGFSLPQTDSKFIRVLDFIEDRLMEATEALSHKDLLTIAAQNRSLYEKFYGDPDELDVKDVPAASDNIYAVKKMSIASQACIHWCNLLMDGLKSKSLRLVDANRHPLPETKLDEVIQSLTRQISEISKTSQTESLDAQIAPKSGPAPLSTTEIAAMFDGLHFESKEKWLKALGDPPKWLIESRLLPGQRGVSQSTWNPVLIGAALIERGTTSQTSIRAKFQRDGVLKQWFDAWKTHEADYLD